jgi:hypothetical protein
MIDEPPRPIATNAELAGTTPTASTSIVSLMSLLRSSFDHVASTTLLDAPGVYVPTWSVDNSNVSFASPETVTLAVPSTRVTGPAGLAAALALAEALDDADAATVADGLGVALAGGVVDVGGATVTAGVCSAAAVGVARLGAALVGVTDVGWVEAVGAMPTHPAATTVTAHTETNCRTGDAFNETPNQWMTRIPSEFTKSRAGTLQEALAEALADATIALDDDGNRGSDLRKLHWWRVA